MYNCTIYKFLPGGSINRDIAVLMVNGEGLIVDACAFFYAVLFFVQRGSNKQGIRELRKRIPRSVRSGVFSQPRKHEEHERFFGLVPWKIIFVSFVAFVVKKGGWGTFIIKS